MRESRADNTEEEKSIGDAQGSMINYRRLKSNI